MVMSMREAAAKMLAEAKAEEAATAAAEQAKILAYRSAASPRHDAGRRDWETVAANPAEPLEAPAPDAVVEPEQPAAVLAARHAAEDALVDCAHCGWMIVRGELPGGRHTWVHASSRWDRCIGGDTWATPTPDTDPDAKAADAAADGLAMDLGFASAPSMAAHWYREVAVARAVHDVRGHQLAAARATSAAALEAAIAAQNAFVAAAAVVAEVEMAAREAGVQL